LLKWFFIRYQMERTQGNRLGEGICGHEQACIRV
jgi:hypothetical protein